MATRPIFTRIKNEPLRVHYSDNFSKPKICQHDSYINPSKLLIEYFDNFKSCKGEFSIYLGNTTINGRDYEIKAKYHGQWKDRNGETQPAYVYFQEYSILGNSLTDSARKILKTHFEKELLEKFHNESETAFELALQTAKFYIRDKLKDYQRGIDEWQQTLEHCI